MTEAEALASIAEVFPGARVIERHDLARLKSVRAQAMEIIDRTVNTIGDMWAPGAPFDGGVFRRWGESLAVAIRRGDLRTVKRDCAKYQTWMAQQITKFTLG